EDRINLDDEHGILRLLVHITVRETLASVRGVQVAKPGGLRQETRLSREEWRSLLTQEPSVDESVAFADKLEHFLRLLSPEELAIVSMRLAGATNQEIASAQGVSERTISRRLERLRSKLEHES